MTFSQLNVSKVSTQTEIVLDRYMYTEGISLLALQETGCWQPSSDMFEGCKVFQNKHNTSSNLYGVAIIASKDLQPEVIDDLSDPTIDAIWIQVKINKKRVIVGSVYCRPSGGLNDLSKLLEGIDPGFQLGRWNSEFCTFPSFSPTFFPPYKHFYPP